MDCSPPGSSVLGNSPGKNTRVGFHALLRGIFLTQGWNPHLLPCRQILYWLIPQGSPWVLSVPRNCGPQTQHQTLGCGPTEAVVAQKQQLSTDLSTSSLFAVILQRLIVLGLSGWRVSGSSDHLVFPTSPLFPNLFHNCVRSNFYIKVFVLYTQGECTSLTEPSLIELLVWNGSRKLNLKDSNLESALIWFDFMT